MSETAKCVLIVPVYNEEEALPIFMEKINALFELEVDVRPVVVFVDDGSSDGTLTELKRIQERDDRVIVIELSRNFGKEAALTAGLAHAVNLGNIFVPMDIDLQDPPDLLPQMIQKWREGYDVVLAQRVRRPSDSFIKRYTAHLFYEIINMLSSVKIPPNVGDFRLMDRSVVQAVNSLPESCRFMKGLFSYVGFRVALLPYVREGRSAGKSKFDMWRLWNFALDGITGFSTVPLRIWSYIGAAISFFSLLLASFFILRTIFFGVDVPGYASLISAVTFLGGVQLIGIGILGEYLGRVYMESKNRPVYFIRRIYGDKENVEGEETVPAVTVRQESKGEGSD